MQLDSINFWLNAFIPNSACVIKGDIFVVASPQSVDPDRGGVVDGIPGSIQIDIVGSAAMPLMPSPDIDYSGTLTIDRLEGNLLFKGAVSNFPAFEIYFRVNDGAAGTLAQIQPQIPLDLFGGETHGVDVSTRIAL